MIKASDYPREYNGPYLQMRLSYSPVAQFFLFLVQWTDCHLASALGLLRILIYKPYADGKTTMSIHERKASIREFYGYHDGGDLSLINATLRRNYRCG
ncbi:hypothetical protein REPUB_Repub08aG0203500 [Reevesia pubescens]